MPESTTEPRLSEAAPALAGHLDHVRRRQGTVAVRTGIAMAITALLAWLAIGMPLDWLFALPFPARAVLLMCGLGGAGMLAWRFGIRHWLHQPDDDRVALAIERALPQFRSRFIASVQLSRQQDGVSHSLVKALITETNGIAADAPFDDAVKTDSLRHWGRIAAGATVLAATLWFAGGRASWPLFQRAWLVNVPVPRKTMIMAFTGDRVIAIGDDLRIEATAAGSVPKSGRLVIESANGRRQEFSLDATPAEPIRFARTLLSVQENFRYRIELGDNRTDLANMRVRARPAVASFACEQQWPAYTKLPPVRRQPGNLKLLAGTNLAVRITATSALRSATLRLTGAEPTNVIRSTALIASDSGEWTGTAEIPAKDVAGMTFHLTDTEGVESRAMAVHRIEVVPDTPPTIRILLPARREELLTHNATLLLGFEAKDDFGVAKVLLHYAVNWTEGAPHKTVELDLAGEQPKVLTRRFEWKIARVTPTPAENDTIDFWLEARDANDVTGPGIAVMPEHYQARIVSDEEKRADLTNRLNDTLQSLDAVRQSQQDLATRLGDLIREKPAITQ
ncbi:MAG: DUF4175 family protein [Chthoniobacteraceae bacterium]